MNNYSHHPNTAPNQPFISSPHDKLYLNHSPPSTSSHLSFTLHNKLTLSATTHHLYLQLSPGATHSSLPSLTPLSHVTLPVFFFPTLHTPYPHVIPYLYVFLPPQRTPYPHAILQSPITHYPPTPWSINLTPHQPPHHLFPHYLRRNTNLNIPQHLHLTSLPFLPINASLVPFPPRLLPSPAPHYGSLKGSPPGPHPKGSGRG